jgi:hypothetical protein
MHPGKKQMVLALALSAAMASVFAWVWVRQPNWIWGTFLILFGLTAIVSAVRVFAYSDDWYRAREHKAQAWAARHPRLMLGLTLLTAIGVTLNLAHFLVELVRRHH